MVIPSSWQEKLGSFLQWEYNTPQFLAFVIPAPFFLIIGAVFSYWWPTASFLFSVSYLFLILPSSVLSERSIVGFRIPSSLLHSFFLFWAIAGLFPMDHYFHLLFG